MLAGSPHIKRLLLCMLASIGLHVGLVLVDWQEAPVRQALLRAPLEVARVEIAASQQAAAAEPVSAADVVEKKPSPAAATVTKPLLPKATGVKVAKPIEPLRRVVVDPPAPQKQPLAVLQAHLAPSSAPAVVSHPVAGSASVEVTLENAIGHEAAGEPSVSVSEVLVEAIPAYRSNPRPEYPLLARQRRWEGVVWLQVDVTAAGDVSAVQVESSSGHTVLDRAAMRSVERWRFAPATRGGVPLDSQVRLPVHFVLKER